MVRDIMPNFDPRFTENLNKKVSLLPAYFPQKKLYITLFYV